MSELLAQLQKELNPGCTMMVNNPDEETLLLNYLQPSMRVLEFGMGLSTLAIAKRVLEVVTMEYNHSFYKDFRGLLPKNAFGVFVAPNAEPKPEYDDGTLEDFQDYVKAPLLFPDPKFDVVFIDGRSRVACAEHAAKYYLKPGGKIFIHDYRHPMPQYRRPYLEEVEKFLNLEQQVYAMAMFSVKAQVQKQPPPLPPSLSSHIKPEPLVYPGLSALSDQQTTGFDEAAKHFDEMVQKVLNDQIKELGGTPNEEAEFINEQKQLADTGLPEYAGRLIKEESVTDPELISSAAQADPLRHISATTQPEAENTHENIPTPAQAIASENIQLPVRHHNDAAAPLVSDINSCWHQSGLIVEEMNRFYDQYIKNHNIADHMAAFVNLLAATDKQGSQLLDIGCGTAMLSEFCKDFHYCGADLPHIIAGCAMRNFPKIWYRAANIEQDDLAWIHQYPVIVLNGVIDVMQYPLQTLRRILQHAKEYVIIHRQEVSGSKATASNQHPSYGGYTWHSIINRPEFVSFLDEMNFIIVKEEKLQFGNWENGGNSFLLRKRKTWALNEMDYKLAAYFPGKENGFFIEAGANDGLRQSNTMFLEFYRNWNGILIEPIQPLMDLCMQNRSKRNLYWQYALTGPGNKERLIDMYFTPENYGLLSVVIDENADKMMKRIGNEEIVKVNVMAASFNDIAASQSQLKYVPEKIDLMVLDIEGQELNALKGIDFDKYKIDYLLIEELNGGNEIADYLATWYQPVDKLSDHDVLYKLK